MVFWVLLRLPLWANGSRVSVLAVQNSLRSKLMLMSVLAVQNMREEGSATHAEKAWPNAAERRSEPRTDLENSSHAST